MTRREARFDLSSGFSKRGFFDKLRKEFRTRRDPNAAERRVYLDTFDWRLFKESVILYSTGSRLVLESMEGEFSVKSIDTTTIPVFLDDVPDGDVKTRLAGMIEMRALMPLAEAMFETSQLRILNRDDKTVARIELEEVKLAVGRREMPAASCVKVKPVRGYDRHARELEAWLSRKGFSCAEADPYSSVLEAAGKSPGDYSAKLNFNLDPRMSSYEAMVRIFRFLAWVMRRNIDGIKQDIDTEFLHDFRVASRRTRAGLVQLKKVLPKGVAGVFRKRFAVFGKSTNRLRDLDVYLLNADEYRRLIPVEVREHIEPLFEHLRTQRAEELDRVSAWLDSSECVETLDEWEAVLGEALDDESANKKSALPVIDLASASIRSRHKIVVEDGKKVAETPEDEALHTLRIECKKLRYLLEFFASLYEKKKVSTLIKQLKRLQDNLGRHQDICFQQEGLRTFAGEMSKTGERTEMTHVAVGALIGSLENDKHAVRDAFSGVFESFTSPENTRLFVELFGKR
jgi:CHAD domain-containing protein